MLLESLNFMLSVTRLTFLEIGYVLPIFLANSVCSIQTQSKYLIKFLFFKTPFIFFDQYFSLISLMKCARIFLKMYHTGYVSHRFSFWTHMHLVYLLMDIFSIRRHHNLVFTYEIGWHLVRLLVFFLLEFRVQQMFSIELDWNVDLLLRVRSIHQYRWRQTLCIT